MKEVDMMTNTTGVEGRAASTQTLAWDSGALHVARFDSAIA